jgi:hypothetical protein
MLPGNRTDGRFRVHESIGHFQITQSFGFFNQHLLLERGYRSRVLLSLNKVRSIRMRILRCVFWNVYDNRVGARSRDIMEYVPVCCQYALYVRTCKYFISVIRWVELNPYGGGEGRYGSGSRTLGWVSLGAGQI